ncbi:MAG: family metallo-hydrolase [Flaviaesturariibacter sp.]|nr:family metallo-hydrolase [Flaviaesturariibacter sp.]
MVIEVNTFVLYSPLKFPAVAYRVFNLVLLLVALSSAAQKIKKEDKLLLDNLKTHIGYLSNDKLEGRRTGTEGERLAALYISGLFQSIGLQPKGTDNYYQTFEISEGRQVNPSTHLYIDETGLVQGKDFFPLTFSGNGSVTALSSLSLQETQTPWFLDLKELLEANKDNPHFDIPDAVRTKVAKMQGKGANAVFVYNTSTIKDNLAFSGKEKVETLPIPVVYLSTEMVKKYLADETASLDIKLKTDIGLKVRKGMNVVGYINNGAANTVVLGAHFDHLGWGEDNNSLHRTGPAALHNGADDNASGTAAVIEIARLLKASKFNGNNYLFIAFSGEELGLYGSKYFVENPTIDLSIVNYMINLDMVGRLNETSPTITVGGFSTTPTWAQLYALTGKKKLYAENLLYRYDSSGTGPSDHTSFYNKGIPVLFYFTGLHSDYHRPSDDADRINYSGEATIIKHILSVIENVNKSKEKLPFSKTREMQLGTSARFSVTMGIMPDYTYGGAGVRVDGVSEGRPAQKAGLRTGDVVTALGEHKVGSVESYMQVLGKFKKGDKTAVTYIRDKQSITTTVEF